VEFSTTGLINKQELYRNTKDLENLMVNYKQVKYEEELIKNNNNKNNNIIKYRYIDIFNYY